MTQPTFEELLMQVAFTASPEQFERIKATIKAAYELGYLDAIHGAPCQAE